MKMSNAKFDPISIWPSRIKGKKWTAKDTSELPKGAGGATDLKKSVAYLPTGNSAYDRTIRLHEALHGIYTKHSTKPLTMLDQALEDARLHLVCAKTNGIVRRDELATALTDVKRGAGGDKALAALLALRSAAIFNSQPSDIQSSAIKKFEKLCAEVAPDYRDKVFEALGRIERGEMVDAERILTPYFPDAPAEPESKVWPSAGKGGKAGEQEQKGDADVSFEKIDGKLSSEAADMLGAEMAKSIAKRKLPTLNIHQLFASAMIPTFFGETTKHMLSGMKISAKKLATIVGPTSPRLFVKTIRRNGGTVVIDASGSMNITPNMLLQMCSKAPAATIAFYNAPNDDVMTGNMWIFAHKGKRAENFAGIVGLSPEGKSLRIDYHDKAKFPLKFGYGNVVDFAVLQWLLAQPAPRYILTDGEFTGPAAYYGVELLSTAIARKKIKQVTSFKEMTDILAKAGKQQ